jgi:hypothetical protein
MGIQIIDDKNILSKNQKQKIKISLANIEYNDEIELKNIVKNTIIPNIYYENEDIKYTDVEVMKEKDDLFILKFIIAPKKDLKTLLSQKLKVQKSIRSSSKDIESKKWKMYRDLSARVPKILPNPDIIKAQHSMYEELLEKIPNTIIKDYFQLCLS